MPFQFLISYLLQLTVCEGGHHLDGGQLENVPEGLRAL
jgi:hypothetical protein